MEAAKKYKCKETGRIGEIIKTPHTNNGEYVLEYEDGTQAPLMPFELEAKYIPIASSKKVATNPLKRSIQ